jgi:hypothetical protein
MSSRIGRWSEMGESSREDLEMGKPEEAMKRSRRELVVAENWIGRLMGCMRE